MKEDRETSRTRYYFEVYKGYTNTSESILGKEFEQQKQIRCMSMVCETRKVQGMKNTGIIMWRTKNIKSVNCIHRICIGIF